MRGVVDKGTGAGIRGKYGLKGDLAGKTGTTQDYTDGWFILIHPDLVGGAWVGFNDNRVRMQDSWGQGARNALHIVGDFFQQSTRQGLVNAKAKFNVPRDISVPPEPLVERMNDWMGVIQISPENQASGQQQQVIVQPFGTQAPVALSEPSVAAAQPQVLEAPHRDNQWFPSRPRSLPEYQQSPGISPEPERSRPLVIRVPNASGGEDRRETMEMGAPPARPALDSPPDLQPQNAPAWRGDGGASRGVRILREVTPGQPAPYIVAPQQ
jgi:penicillin-binding protein 1A